MAFKSHTCSRYVALLGALLIAALAASCAVMSKEIDEKALPQLPFDDLLRTTPAYKGDTVILGGYVLSVENRKTQTHMVAVQAPLGSGQRPKSKDSSKGRLVLIYDGFLDPEVFTKDRQITIGGTLIGSSTTEQDQHPFPYLRVRIEEIHLWPEPEPDSLDPFWGRDCYPHGPWGLHRHHRWHPWCW